MRWLWIDLIDAVTGGWFGFVIDLVGTWRARMEGRPLIAREDVEMSR